MRVKIFSIIILTVFISCKTDKPKINKKSDFVKTWFDTVRMVPFESKLIINENKTFDYLGGACTSSFFSKGYWKIKEDTLILTSSKIDKCYWKENFGPICFTNEEIEKMQEDNKTIKNCKPIGEESYVFFNQEKFYLRNDTLIHARENKNCPNLRIALSSIKKIK